MSKLLIKNALIKHDADPVDILIEDKKIVEIETEIKSEGKVIDAEGCAVLPTLIESHIHPDKAFLDARKPNQSGTLKEAMENTVELKKHYTYEDVYARSEKVIRMAILKGTTIMRAHPDVDLYEETLGVEVLLDLKEKYKEVLDMQIVAFPQEGILKSKGVEALLRKTLQMGADVIGGCPYAENNLEDAKKHLEVVFNLSKEFNVPIDIHADFSTDINDPKNNMIECICDMTIQEGMKGQVTVGHVTTLGSLPPHVTDKLFPKISEAGITIVPLPVTDMFMNGRDATYNIPRGMAPVKRLMEAGVNVVYSSNNIRNAFTPYGNADLLAVGYLLQVSQQLGAIEERLRVLDMVTGNAAKALGISDTYGIEVGKDADLVIFENKELPNLINDQPLVKYVIKNGEIIVEKELKMKVHDVLK